MLISDLYEGGNHQAMVQRVAALVGNGLQFIALLALNDDGAPVYDHSVAEQLAELGIPAFACTLDQFPNLMAATISRQDIGLWAAANDIVIPF